MKRILIAILCAVFLVGCGPKFPKEVLELSPESLQDRQLQTRRFDTTDKGTMLNAASAVMQDLGFTLEESEVPLGVLTGSKERDAKNAGQIVGSILLAALVGANVPWDATQSIRVSMVMHENTAQDSIIRVTFQRLIFNNHGQAWKAQQIKDADIYKEFFERLSKAVFLEAHEI